MTSPVTWISTHPETFTLISGAVVSLVASVAKYVLTPDFEEAYPKTSKVIRVFAKLSSDVFGAYTEVKKKPVPPSNPTIIVMPEDPK